MGRQLPHVIAEILLKEAIKIMTIPLTLYLKLA
jgi:hypothetical protein